MTEKTRFQSPPTHPNAFSNFEDHELKATMQDFLKEKEKEERSSIWNFATIAGIAMFFVSMLYVLQLAGLHIADGLGGLMNVLPFVGALLVGTVAFGYFVGDRKRVKQILKKQRKRRQDYFEKAFPEGAADSDIDLEKELFGSESTSGKRPKAPPFDAYALQQSKKLYKSRTDKKIGGVCGGLANYYGISSTMVRVLFAVTFFASSGSSFFIYFVLWIALKKEPEKLRDDYSL